eukprot:CAMPEP_0176104404 /NCGR_PEP_ID=MMETSP0120_2-20121206/52387_1 /TAXON_ID=160619 /ORGANISM="Kryptoperidinium foliaceum, Strain CCMP 1326" /LENGTH=72 /DNA_ID=CAMNT_0017438507 /DNA_START=57 /DNA_END=275 /DNA_ORIENTATION=-
MGHQVSVLQEICAQRKAEFCDPSPMGDAASESRNEAINAAAHLQNRSEAINAAAAAAAARRASAISTVSEGA